MKYFLSIILILNYVNAQASSWVNFSTEICNNSPIGENYYIAAYRQYQSKITSCTGVDNTCSTLADSKYHIDHMNNAPVIFKLSPRACSTINYQMLVNDPNVLDFTQAKDDDLQLIVATDGQSGSYLNNFTVGGLIYLHGKADTSLVAEIVTPSLETSMINLADSELLDALGLGALVMAPIFSAGHVNIYLKLTTTDKDDFYLADSIGGNNVVKISPFASYPNYNKTPTIHLVNLKQNITPSKNIPAGSYTTMCKNINYTNGQLNADCNNGLDTRNYSLNYMDSCPSGSQVIFLDNNLQCEQKLPNGSYQSSCSNVIFKNGILSADCVERIGNSSWSQSSNLAYNLRCKPNSVSAPRTSSRILF
ncbi:MULTISPECIES: hypothetical protein [Cysteiniphilum]|uniref:Uncharacterized protein n=1 Tax=Cysteiniphilum litorale TaxID=2056700 RepID=A0A8J2Z6F6_9GAMM|nr:MULTISPECIES: hypothetical protein [Cysteiniphilum]GGG04941.1 hypothetical protein GCM10010995_22970 [Cysteiniphilum litorale]